MSRTLSPSSKRSYGVARVIAVWQLARSSFYAARWRQQHPRQAAKRGPKRLSDEELAREIRQVLDQSVFHGEGYRKVWARLRHKGIRVWKDRVLRVMREHQLLSPSRQPDEAIGLGTTAHLRDVLALRPHSRAKAGLYKLFEKLGQDFNGDLFSEDLRAEAEQVAAEYIGPLDA